MTTITDQLHALKFVTDSLSTARRDQLPQIIPSLTNHLSICSELLCSKAKNPQTAAAASTLVHRLKTQISSLLQDKSSQGRWTAVVLVKTVIECVVHHQEGWEFLRTSPAWIRGLLLILGKPDPPTTKIMTMVTLTRIFLLTHGQPSLAREITTPHLASFITACLNLITTKSTGRNGRILDQSNDLLGTVLQCLIRLLPNHPAAFRPFGNQIRSLISPLVAPTPSDLSDNEEGQISMLGRNSSALARHLHALLPSCVAKNGAAEEWRKYVDIIIKQINQTADNAFRSISNRVNNLAEVPEEPTSQIEDELMLTGWQGVAAGCERLSGLLLLLSAYLTTKGNMSYQTPIKPIYEMTDRLLSSRRPQSLVSRAPLDETNRQFTREERETLYMILPHVHIAALDVLTAMIDRMSLLCFGIAEDLLEQVAWVMQGSSLITNLRSSVYRLADRIVGMIGTSIPPQKSASICAIIRMACRDLISEAGELHSIVPNVNGSILKPDYNADTFTSNAVSSLKKAKTLSSHQQNALSFLCTALLRVPASTLSSVREQIDTVAVLLQHEKLQLASILNPQINSRDQTANLVPFLAKSHDPLVEALIHRRIGAIAREDNTSDDNGVEFETDDITLEPNFVIPPFNSNLANTFKTVSHSEPQEISTSMEDAETLNTKRTAQSIDLDNTTPQVEETEHIKKKPRLQDLETQIPSNMVLDRTTQSEEVADSIEVGALTSTIDNETVAIRSDSGNSDSDDSFEIPEIIVDLDDEDSQEEQQD